MIARKLPASFFAWFMFLCLIATLVAVFLVALPCAHGQTIDSSIHVKAYPGNDVGTKVANAMANCDPTLPCILVIDPSLANLAAGTMPALCATCSLADYRGGSPQAQGMTCTGVGASRTCGSPQKITLSTGGTPRAGLDTVLTTTPTTRNIVVLNYLPGTQTLTVTFSASLPVGPFPYTFSGLTNVTSLNGQTLTPSTVSGGNATFTFNTGTGRLSDASDTGSASIAVPGSTGYVEVDDGAGANSNGSFRAHDLTLSGPGCGAGKLAMADGSGCTSSAVAGVATFNSRSGPVLPVASDYAPALGSNSLPPTSHYNMPPMTVYIPLLQLANCSSSSNLSNAATGLVATTAGVTGTCTINLNKPIDPTIPFRFTVAASGPDGTYSSSVKLWDYTNAQHGAIFTIGTTYYQDQALWVGADWSVNNEMSAVTNGTPVVWNIIGDGNSLTASIVPNPGATATALYAPCATFQGAYNGGLCHGTAGAQVVNATYGAVTANWNTITISTSSATNVISGLLLSQGFIGGSPDGLMNIPAVMLAKTGIAQAPLSTDAPTYNVGAGPSLIFIPGTYGTPNGTPLVMLHHQNAGTGINGTTSASSVAALLNAGYIVAYEQGYGYNFCSGDALCSNMGANPGLLMRKKLVDYVRANLPATTQLFHMGLSMGLLNALNYEAAYPGSAGIIGVSGVSGLQQVYNQTTPYANVQSVIEAGFGNFYSSILAGTNQNPASAATYWNAVSGTPPVLGENYVSYPQFTFKGPWNSGTAYTTTQMVNVPRSDGSWPSVLNGYDPYQHPSLYAGVPILLSYCDPTVNPGDTTLDPHQSLNFYTAVTAVGGNVTKLPSLNGSCVHLSADQFAPSTFVSFFNTYRTTNAPAQFGTTQATSSATCAFPSTCVAPVITTLHATTSAAVTQPTYTPVMTILPSLASGQNVAVSCKLYWQTINASYGISLQLSGQNGSSSYGNASIQTNLSTGTTTNFDADGVAASGTLTFTGPTTSTAANTTYSVTVDATVYNGPSTAAPLVLAIATNTGATAAKIMQYSKCTVSPAQ